MMRSLVVCAVLLGSAVTAAAQAPGHDGALLSTASDHPTAAAPQRQEEGRPFIRAYAPTDVGGNSQIWVYVVDIGLDSPKEQMVRDGSPDLAISQDRAVKVLE